jgi:hypothetical protein
MLELGIPPEWVENIEMTLTGFAREALAHFKQGRPALPERIRVFCQKKMVAEKMSGGWGYFLIERTESPCDTFAGRPHQIVDLYLYREGE